MAASEGSGVEWSAVPGSDAALSSEVSAGDRGSKRWIMLVGVSLGVAACGAALLTGGFLLTRPAAPPPPKQQIVKTPKPTQPPVEVTQATTVTTTTQTTTTDTTLPHPNIGNETCLSEEGCEDQYPLPYLPGEYPETYDYSGKFPEGFVWGVGTAAYQVEGAYREGGRGVSIWDTFTGADTVGMPGNTCGYCCQQAPCPVSPSMAAKGATGNVACDHYHMIDNDLALMKSMGLKHYRFSIAWPRIFPTGNSKDGVNPEGKRFYNDLIDKLLALGIEPYVTLYHWDLPQGLFDPPAKMAWWARDSELRPLPEIQDEFLAFADFCFSTYGDRVKMWFTFNEPWTFTYLASGWGKAPCHPKLLNWTVDPYIAGHNILNAHAAVVNLYRTKHKSRQHGMIGITLNSDWREPRTDDPQDVASAMRGMDFNLGWFADPIFGGNGDYPPAMRRWYGSRLPNFTREERTLLNYSADFFALNHYGTTFSSFEKPNGNHDSSLSVITFGNLVQGQSNWLYGAAWGLRKLLNWVHDRYDSPMIYLTEGGWSIEERTAEEAIQDTMRVLYYSNYTSEILRAINEDGIDVRGYFAWSLFDNFEWERGFVERFGTVFNDYVFGYDERSPMDKNAQPTKGYQVRTRKSSSCWLEAVWTSNTWINPLTEEFKGCVSPLVFAGDFFDPRHPHCIRSISVDKGGRGGHIIGTDNDKGSGCDGKNDKVWGPLAARISGGTIIVDFSSIDGPDHLLGFWNRTTLAIEWGDGHSWISLHNPGPVHYKLTEAFVA